MTKDDTLAVRWFHKAAEQGHAQAQNSLGAYYSDPNVADYEQAVYWYRRAVEQGHVQAQSNLGILYYAGRGVAKNDTVAASLFRKAAEQGHAQGQRHLGLFYEYGKGVAKSNTLALYWYEQSLKNQQPDDQLMVQDLKERIEKLKR